ncbi:unnamed protein product [Laminaria digitata]
MQLHLFRVLVSVSALEKPLYDFWSGSFSKTLVPVTASKATGLFPRQKNTGCAPVLQASAWSLINGSDFYEADRLEADRFL